MSQDMNKTSFDTSTAFKQRINGPLFMRYKQLALDNQVWLSLGSFPERDEFNKDILYQTHAIVNQEGSMTASYRKMHMFDALITDTD